MGLSDFNSSSVWGRFNLLNSTAIKYQVETIEAIRNFFQRHQFKEVLTPPAVENPGMETHIHPFQLHQVKSNTNHPYYLHTSPEFELKNVLAQISDLKDIYSLTYCFRDEPQSPHHRFQFLMLEWYRKNHDFFKIMHDCENILKEFSSTLSFSKAEITQVERMSVNDLFDEFLGFKITDFLDRDELIKKIKADLPNIVLPSQICTWDDYFFLIFLNEIEPRLKDFKAIILYHYPAPLAALSSLSKNDPKVCERFELYINGLEIANCFSELTDVNEQKKRFTHQAQEKQEIYEYQLPHPSSFYESMERGLPTSAGIALGVERLIQALSNIKNPFFR